MNYNSLQLFEYALLVFSENSNSSYEMIIEYDHKLITGKFLSNDIVYPKGEEYTETFTRRNVLTDFENENFDDAIFAVVKMLNLISERFVARFTNNPVVPDSIDLINAINHLVSLVPANAKTLDSFNTATNVTFLETNLNFDFYRFPDDATFNVVSLKKLDN